MGCSRLIIPSQAEVKPSESMLATIEEPPLLQNGSLEEVATVLLETAAILGECRIKHKALADAWRDVGDH